MTLDMITIVDMTDGFSVNLFLNIKNEPIIHC